MAMILPRANDNADFVVPEAGIYTAEFEKYDGPKQSQFDNLCIDMFFTIINDEEYDGVTLKRTYGWTMGRGSKLKPVISALVGQPVTPDDEIDLNELMGTQVQISVVNVEKPDRDNPKELRTWANIDTVSPIRRRASKKVVAEAVEPAPERITRTGSSLKGTTFDVDEEGE